MTDMDALGNETVAAEQPVSWLATTASNRAIRASIIIVNYNGGEKLASCLKSVSAHLDSRSEIILVDNASHDGSVDAVADHFPQVKLIRAGANLGFGAGNNLGVTHASGDYLIFLNPDTLVEENWLDALLAPMEGGTDVGLVTA